jgi:hypothetical protein
MTPTKQKKTTTADWLLCMVILTSKAETNLSLRLASGKQTLLAAGQFRCRRNLLRPCEHPGKSASGSDQPLTRLRRFSLDEGAARVKHVGLDRKQGQNRIEYVGWRYSGRRGDGLLARTIFTMSGLLPVLGQCHAACIAMEHHGLLHQRLTMVGH